MPITRRKLVLTGATAALASPFLARAAANPWLIGQSSPQTGVLAASSAETTSGTRLYFSRLNARGGVHGRPVELVSLDDGQDAKRAAANTQTLLDQGVHALAMYRTTPTIEASLPLARKAGIAFIGNQVGPSLLYEAGLSNVFNTRASYHDEVSRAVKFFNQLGVDRVAALAASDAFGKDVMAGLKLATAQMKVDLVAQASLDNRVADVGAQLEQIRAAKPQIVLLIANGKAASEFVKRARASDFAPTFVALSNNSSATFVKDLERYAEGVVVTQVLPTPYSGRVRVVSEFREALAQAGAGAPVLSHATLQGYVNGKFIHEAIRRAGPDADRTRVVQALNGAGRIDLGDFALSYSSDSRQGSRLAELTVIGRDGRFMY